MNYYLFSQEKEQIVFYSETFEKDKIKEAIIKHLTENKNDVLEYCKDYPKNSIKKYYGMNILSFYQNNKKGIPCKVILRGDKEYFKTLN